MYQHPLITGRHEGNPLEPAAAAPPTSRTIKVDFITAEDAAKEAINLAQNGGAVLWICNTVDSAQKQYQRFTGLTQEDFPVGLLHSRFPFWRREEIEAEWMTRFGKNGATRCGSILVSTQIVEQSVDLDADLLITELAPTDMLLQRLGRLWRHNRKDDDRPVDTARLCIVKEKNSLEDFRNMEPKAIIDALGGKAHVYDPFVLLRSLDVWHGQNEVNIPAQIRMLIELTYEDRDNEPESWLKLYDDAYGQALAHRQRALMSSNIWSVALSDAEGVQTRLNEMPTVVLVLCRSLSDHKATFIDQSRGCLGSDQYRLPTAQAIHKNLVKIPRYHFDCIELCSAFTDYLYGEQSIGIVAESGAVEVKGLKDGTLLFYSDELGLIIKKSS